MSDSSDEIEENYVLYRDRPDWKDVVPIPQDDGDTGIVQISYSEQFRDVHDYFRAILKSGEKSERALELTARATELNPANYTIWHYRREILKALNKDLHEELKLIDKYIMEQSKNYQVWHHRRAIVEWLKDPSQEKFFTQSVLSKDAKNYHAWQHRQWVIKTFNLFEGELDYVENLIFEDVRNNSAWNQRYFVINNTTGFTPEVLDVEIDYTLNQIKSVLENESAWNYLRGLLLHDTGKLSKNQKVTSFCEDLYENGERSPFLLAMIVDMCYEQVQNGGGESIYTLDRALSLCSDLANQYDVIRAKYWEYMADTIKKKASGETVEEASSSST